LLLTSFPRDRRRAAWPLGVGLALALAPAPGAADPSLPCFDFARAVNEPLRPPIPLLDDRDNSAFGTYPGGVGWAAGRALVEMPIGATYARLLDHRNVKDMSRMTLVTRIVERPDYLEFHEVDVAIRLRALFLKLTVQWTEEWAYRLVEGTKEAPRKIVVSYQKVAGSRYLEHQCGSYVLTARGASTDLALYEEVKARRRTPEDTRDMHVGILQGFRSGSGP
jgi:hypothetical protein